LSVLPDTLAGPTSMKHFTILKKLAFFVALLPTFASAQAPESVMVVEAHSGKILIAANASARRPVASLTKIATAAVAVDWAIATETDLGKITITVPQTVTLVGGPNPMNLQPGDRLTLRDALYSALLGSDNLAALAIADHIGREILYRREKAGDPVGTFVGEMNQLAKAIGMTQTLFANPHGLDRPGARAYSTAADMARLSIYAMRRNAFNFIVRQPERQVSVTGAAGKRGYRVRNSNQLVGETGILGVKTGTTNAAGPCLSVCMDRDPLIRVKEDGAKGVTPRRLIVVILNNPDRFQRARGLIRQGWAVYDPWLAAGGLVEDYQREILSLSKPQ
jgi:D-alanyl-D-alanine carboxypeptidase (penicillin-binding protein 5/6)